MHMYYHEPTLDDVLSDPIVRAMMAADGVNPRELKVMLTRVGASRLRDDERWIPWLPDTPSD